MRSDARGSSVFLGLHYVFTLGGKSSALCSRYVKYRARVAALALDPAIQGIVYCGIFMFMPLGTALLPLFMKELVYMLWVIKEVLQIVAPGERRQKALVLAGAVQYVS